LPFTFDSIGSVVHRRFISSEPLLRHVCPCGAAKLADFLIGQATWPAQKATDRDFLIGTFGSNNVIDADRLIQVHRFDLIDQHSVLVFSGRVVWIVAGVWYDLSHWPHSNEIPSAYIVLAQAFA
jgi:hypothetical protein